MEFLRELAKNLKKQIVYFDVDLRWMEREKLSAKDSQLIGLEKFIKDSRGTKDASEKKLEVVQDELEELSK